MAKIHWQSNGNIS